MASQAFDLQRLKRSFFGVSGLYLVGIPLLLLANIVLARTLSVADFGTFGFALSIATVLAIPVSGGLPMLLTREVAAYSQGENWPAYRGLIIAAYAWVAAICGVIGIGLLLFWFLVDSTPAAPLLIALLIVPFLGLNALRNGILKGLGRPMLAEAPTQVLQPALMIIGYLGLAWIGLSSAIGVLFWYVCVVLVVFVLASVLLWRVQPAEVRGVVASLEDLPRWRVAIFPFIMISAANVLGTQVAVLMLGFDGQEESVAFLRVAERGAQLVAFPLMFINTIIGPYFVQALKSEEDGALRRVTRQSARLTLLVSLPVGLLLILFGSDLINWAFGAPYGVQAYWPMVIMIVGHVIAVALGNGGMLLAMGGHERHSLYGMLLLLVVTAGLCLMLIGPYGAMGAAVAASVGRIAAKVYYYVVVRRLYAISSGII